MPGLVLVRKIISARIYFVWYLAAPFVRRASTSQAFNKRKSPNCVPSCVKVTMRRREVMNKKDDGEVAMLRSCDARSFTMRIFVSHRNSSRFRIVISLLRLAFLNFAL